MHGGDARRMDIRCHKEDGVAVLALAGSLETRTAVEFEEVVRKLLETDACHVVIDLEALDQLTSAGIRELVKLRNRLDGLGGSLVLCALREQVATVVEISGFQGHFIIEPSRESALQRVVCADDGAERGGSGSRLSRLVLRLLQEVSRADSERQAASGKSLSPMAGELATLLSDGVEGGQEVSRRSDSSGENAPGGTSGAIPSVTRQNESSRVTES